MIACLGHAMPCDGYTRNRKNVKAIKSGPYHSQEDLYASVPGSVRDPHPLRACTDLPPSHRHQYTSPPQGRHLFSVQPSRRRVTREVQEPSPDKDVVAYFPGQSGQGLKVVTGEQRYLPADNFTVALWVKPEGGQHLDATIIGGWGISLLLCVVESWRGQHLNATIIGRWGISLLSCVVEGWRG